MAGCSTLLPAPLAAADDGQPDARFWHQTSVGYVGSDVGDWMMNGHIAGSAIR
jgi:hypothetical protein